MTEQIYPIISQVSIVPSQGKYGVVLDVVYKGRTTAIVDLIEEHEEEAIDRARFLCNLWDIRLHIVK